MDRLLDVTANRTGKSISSLNKPRGPQSESKYIQTHTGIHRAKRKVQIRIFQLNMLLFRLKAKVKYRQEHKQITCPIGRLCSYDLYYRKKSWRPT